MANDWLEATQTASQEDQVCVTLQSLPCQSCWANFAGPTWGSLFVCPPRRTRMVYLGSVQNITWLIVIVCPACTVVFGGRCLRVISGIINGTHPPFCDSNELSLGDFHYSVWRRYPRQGWVTNGTVAPPVAWISHDTASGLTEALL